MEKLILIGAGGYAKSVLDSIDIYNYTMVGFLDEFSEKKEHLGYPVIAKSLDHIDDAAKYVYFIAIGNNIQRKIWFDRLQEKNLRIINIIDKSAMVSAHACIGQGCFIGKMAIVNSCANIGDNCIINTKALVEHGCSVASHANLSTNSVINGDVKIGAGCFIGSSSTVIGQLSVGNWSTVGAGAVVIRNVEENITVAGVPAKKISERVMLG